MAEEPTDERADVRDVVTGAFKDLIQVLEYEIRRMEEELRKSDDDNDHQICFLAHVFMVSQNIQNWGILFEKGLLKMDEEFGRRLLTSAYDMFSTASNQALLRALGEIVENDSPPEESDEGPTEDDTWGYI